MMVLKRGIVRVLGAARAPLSWIFTALLSPLFVLAYRSYRVVRKGLRAALRPAKDGAVSLLAGKYAIHASVVMLTFVVTGSNLHASDSAPVIESSGTRSLLSAILIDPEEEILVEEMVEETLAVNEGISYLGDQAVSANDAVGAETYDGTDDGQYVDEDPASYQLIANAVRVVPETAPGDRPPTRTRIEEYVVQPGDSLGSIARQFGLMTSTIMSANGLSARSIIRPGQTLKIMPVDGVIYKTKSGDTLSKIAKTYSTDAEKIMAANGMADASSLAVGMELILPDGRAPAPPPPAPSRIAGSLKDVFVPPPAAADVVGTGRLLWPTAARRITQYFKYRHTGVDIAGPTGTSIYAADDGVVSFSGWNSGGYGNMIIVDHGNGVLTRYAHASRNMVAAGDTVKRGDVIALMGSTGRSTGPHLHFEVMLGNISRRVNPFDYIQ
jgi:murein DD-endopeptidase MepM/ murein hydrolase activator NlpD